MTTINRLSSVDALQPGDLIPVWDTSNGDPRKASLGTLLGFIEANYADPDYETRVLTPLEDFFTVTAGNTGTSLWLIINPVTAFTTGTLQLPPASSATNDQEITVVFTAGVTDLTVASAGATVLGAPIRIGAYDSFRVRYNAGQLKWYTLDTTGDGSGPTASILRQTFAGDGVTTNYTLAEIPPALGETLQIFIDGVYQERASYNIAGAFLIFSAPPPNGTVIEVLSWDALGGGTTTADLVSYNRDSGGVLTTVAEELDRTTTINVTAYELGTTAAASSHAGIITGHIIRTNYFDSARTAGSGAEHSYTGVTTLGKAGNWPDADGYFYDVDGRQFEVVGAEIFPQMFGAVGGGEGTDDTSSLLAAFAFLNVRGGQLTMTNKHYADAVLTITGNNVSIVGANRSSGFVFEYHASTLRCIVVNGNDVSLRDFSIASVNTISRTGTIGSVSGNGADNLLVDGLVISDGSATGIHLINCQRAKITNNVIHGTWADGIHVQRGSQNFYIAGNTCYNNGDDCIGIVSHGYDEYGFAGNGVISGNTLRDTTDTKPGSGVALIGVIGCSVINNNITNTALSGIRVSEYFDAVEGDAVSGNHVIADNLIKGGGTGSFTTGGAVKNGISVFNSRNVKVSNNEIFDSFGAAVVISQGAISIEVSNNMITKTGARGIWVASGSMTGNYLRLWTLPEFDDGESQAYVRTHYLKITDNIIRRTATDGIYIDGNASGQSYAPIVSGNIMYDLNTTSAGSIYGIFDTYCTNGIIRDNVVVSSIGALALNFVGLNTTNRVSIGNFPLANNQISYIGLAGHQRGGSAPVSGNFALGDTTWNWNPGSGVLCWVCSTAGTFGTLVGVTGDITSGTAALTVNTVTGLAVGKYITVAGVSGTFTILSIVGLVVTLSGNANATVAAAAVAYKTPVFSTVNIN